MSDFDVLSLATGSFEQLESECAIVDHRSGDDEIVQSIAEFINPDNGILNWQKETDAYFLVWHGVKHCVPLTLTRHDRYVTISSIAHVISDMYDLWLLKARLNDDTHSVLLLPIADSAKLEATAPQWTKDTLEKLDIGYDYFNKIRIPYTDNENHNPNFREDAANVEAEMREMIEAMRDFFQSQAKI
jgi:hypothetical protein